MKKIFTHLTFYVLLALIAGIALGHYYPELGVKMKVVGETFVTIIKIFVVPIIFLTVVLGISSIGNLKKVGKIGLKSLIYFEIVTTLALTIGIVLAYVLKPGHIDISLLAENDISKFTKKPAFSIGKFILNNLSIIVLCLAITYGIILTYSPKREVIVEKLDKASKFVFKILKMVMYLAPLGAFGGIAGAVGKYGIHTLLPLGKLVGSVYLSMFLFVFLILGFIMWIYKLNLWKFLKYIREEIGIVFGTSSSETALPNLMEKLEKLGCKASVVRLVVPTGYSFNLDGTAIYLSMSVIFIAQLFNVHLSFGEILFIIGLLMITSKGAAGVTGSGFVVLASTLASLHNKIPVEGLAFLLGVDKFLSESRAITNIIGNGVATLVIAKSEKEFDEEMYMKEINQIN
jgi:aerobic C4-dicarboxylate transport protein